MERQRRSARARWANTRDRKPRSLDLHLGCPRRSGTTLLARDRRHRICPDGVPGRTLHRGHQRSQQQDSHLGLQLGPRAAGVARRQWLAGPSTGSYIGGQIQFSHDGKMLAACRDGMHVNLYEMATWRRRLELKVASDWWAKDLTSEWLASVAFSPDGRLLAGGSSAGTITLWHAGTGRIIHTFSGHRGNV